MNTPQKSLNQNELDLLKGIDSVTSGHVPKVVAQGLDTLASTVKIAGDALTLKDHATHPGEKNLSNLEVAEQMKTADVVKDSLTATANTIKLGQALALVW